MRVVLVVALVLLAGCGRPSDGTQPTPTDTVTAGNAYFTDPVDPDVQKEYDLLLANFTELNGSVVLSLEFRDVFSPRPKIDAAFEAIVHEERTQFIARSVADLSYPPPHVRYELVRVEDGKQVVVGSLCAVHISAAAPYRIQVDLPHNMTGFVDGASIVSLHVETRDFENQTVYDSGEGAHVFAVRGGPNPHAPDCPLLAERPK